MVFISLFFLDSAKILEVTASQVEAGLYPAELGSGNANLEVKRWGCSPTVHQSRPQVLMGKKKSVNGRVWKSLFRFRYLAIREAGSR